MELTEKQRQRVAAYLAQVARYLADMPEDGRRDAIGQLKERIGRELRGFDDGTADDEAVRRVLENCGPPATQAARLAGERVPVRYAFLAWPDRVWLGVCGGIAHQLGAPPGVVRLIAVLLGLVVPLLPVLLVVYLCVFLVAYVSSNARDIPRVRALGIVRSVLATLGTALGLFTGAKALLWLVSRIYTNAAGEVLYVEGRWAWFLYYDQTLLVWLLMLVLPVAILAALPVQPAWTTTLRKAVHAGLALYAMAVAFGVACVFVGIVLRVSKGMSGAGGIEALKQFL